MLSVIIATFNSEHALVPTLASLVSGATDGLISEVLIADGGSRDDTAGVADVAGCRFLNMQGPQGHRLAAAAGMARASWLLFLRPGTVLDTLWTGETRRFVERPPRQDSAAVFRRGAPAQSSIGEALSLLAVALGRRPRPEQGLLISKQFYAALGGHSERTDEPETDLIRRIGRRRIVTLSAGAFVAL